jgi:hypothetical protein
MSDPKTQKPSTPDSLTQASKNASVELSESELSKVAGGEALKVTQDVTVNKAKTADKAFQAMDGYIRG